MNLLEKKTIWNNTNKKVLYFLKFYSMFDPLLFYPAFHFDQEKSAKCGEPWSSKYSELKKKVR